MVGIVLVSHSRALALSVQELVRSMTGPALPLAVAAGVGDNHQELGTDAVEIAEAIVSVKGPDGVLVLMDMGSAILSAETALDLLDAPLRANIRFCAAPFVEGAVASGVTANLGSSLDEVCAEALASLKQKQAALSSNQPAAAAKSEPVGKESNGHASTGKVEKIRLTVRNVHGLHARPAARLIMEMRPFHSEITVRNLSNQRGPVSVKSLSSLAGLEILEDNEIEVAASGDDAPAALEKMSRLVQSGLGDPPPTETQSAASRPKAKLAVQRKTPSGPVPISGGIAIGAGVYFQPEKLEIPQDKAGDVAGEIKRLQSAIAAAQKTLESRIAKMTATVGVANAGIYEAQILALQDPELVEAAIRLIRDEQVNAAMAWDRANRQFVDRYEALQDPYLRERAVDLQDVGAQVLALLVAKKSGVPAFDEPGVLIAESLTPFQVSTLNRRLVQGVILLDGGRTAHASILLKALGIPAVVQARSVFAEVKWSEPHLVAFDGGTGKIWIDPDEFLLAELQNRQVEEREREAEERKASTLPGATLDGRPVEIFANIGKASEVEAALHSGAEGVGLLRTEFLFLERDSAPTEEEQIQALLAISDHMKGRPLIVRTIDVGGDKELPYLKRAPEENPFLGVRAIRLCFTHEELFNTQLRAILRAGHGRDFRIMFPMIANVTDLERALECLEKVHLDLEVEKVPHLWPVKTGIMIEIPSAAIQAESMARQADFFSIGTNDLTQYTLAADRGNPELASYQDALHPALLRLIEMVVAGARKHNRLVAVCGEAASDEKAASIFIGLGVQELSLAGAKIPRIKACLRKQSFAGLQKLAHTALHCQTAAEVRALITPN
jgi:phosphocarrier protein FPr